jgi:hypothetical protein
MPQKVQGVIFTEIIPKLIPEVNTRNLVRLGSIVRKMNRARAYEPLTDALRKIQWVKLTAIEALSIETDIISAMEPGAIVSYPYGQIRHSLAVTDALLHTKSALDSIAVFLADFLKLRAKGANRDFKKPEFREEVYSNDPVLGMQLKALEPWFQELQEIRDEWIHRSSIRNMLIVGPSDCGPLPIPRKDLNLGLRVFDRPITRKNFFSTKEFLDHHYNNLVTMFETVVQRCIEVALIAGTEPPIDLEVEKSPAFFPLKSTQSMSVTKFKVKMSPLGF